MSNDIIATVPDFTLIPAGAIYRGKSGKDLKVEFKSDQKPTVIKEKLVEVKPDGSAVFRKSGETAKTSAELIKDGKSPGKEPPVKPKDDKEKPKVEADDAGGKVK